MVNLRWFRKHQKVMLVFFGVILMAVFVLGSVVDIFNSSNRPSSSEEQARIETPIVQWTGGTLNRLELQRLIELHFATINLQQVLLEASAKRSPNGPPVRPIQPIGDANSVESADRAIFARFMMSQYARQKLGMIISDDAVLDYLSNLAGTDLSQRALIGICRKANSRFGYNQIHEYLKMEIASMRFEDIIGESFFMSGNGTAPASVLDAWQAFIQTEKQIECAVEEFNASDFVSQVTAQPSTAELRKIFDEGKSFDRDPTGERPGFKRPRKVRVEYVIAEGTGFLDLAIQDVTAEQVLTEYNRLVAAKDPLVMEDIPATETPAAPPAEGEKLQDDPAPVPPAGEDKPPSEPAAEDKGPESNSPETPSEPKSETPKTDDGQAPNSGGGSSSLRLADEISYVAFRASAQEGTDSAAPKQESGSEPEPAPPTSAEPTPPAANDPAAAQEENKSQDKATDDPPAPTNQPPAAAAPNQADQAPAQRPKPLDAALELRIKQRLKAKEAAERQSLAVEAARNFMSDYALAVSDYESTKDLPSVEPKPKKPDRPDLKSFAAENHLKYGHTELCTYEELIKDPIGTATEFRQNPNTGQFGTRRVSDDLFVNFDRKQVFSVEEINAMGDNYVYWLTEKVDSRVPSFAEAQSDVTDFWKSQQALELAKAAATKVRDEFQASGKLLSEEHKDKALLTGGFRWFQTTFGQMSYGAPKGVKNAGEEFMTVAFSLKPKELGVAVNDDRTAYYVVQLIAGDPRTDEQLRDQFLNNIATVRQIVPSNINSFYNRKSVDKLVDGLNEELQVQWLAY